MLSGYFVACVDPLLDRRARKYDFEAGRSYISPSLARWDDKTQHRPTPALILELCTHSICDTL